MGLAIPSLLVLSSLGHMNQEQLMSTSDVALRLSITRQTASRYCREGRIPSIQLGNQFRVRPNDLEKFITRSSYTPPEFGGLQRRPRIEPDEQIRILEMVRSTL